jgi:hypothetical protein
VCVCVCARALCAVHVCQIPCRGRRQNVRAHAPDAHTHMAYTADWLFAAAGSKVRSRSSSRCRPSIESSLCTIYSVPDSHSHAGAPARASRPRTSSRYHISGQSPRTRGRRAGPPGGAHAPSLALDVANWSLFVVAARVARHPLSRALQRVAPEDEARDTVLLNQLPEQFLWRRLALSRRPRARRHRIVIWRVRVSPSFRTSIFEDAAAKPSSLW